MHKNLAEQEADAAVAAETEWRQHQWPKAAILFQASAGSEAERKLQFVVFGTSTTVRAG